MGLVGKFIKKKMIKNPLPKISQFYIVQIGGEIKLFYFSFKIIPSLQKS